MATQQYVRLASGQQCPVVTRDGAECLELRMELPCLECFDTQAPDCGECGGAGRTLQEWREPVTGLVVTEGGE